MTGVTTHVLDTSKGKPAQGVRVQLQHNVGTIDGSNFDWIDIGETVTNSDGRGSSPLIAASSGK